MLDGASPPVCVGLYANWGSGKSFLMHRLKMRFDETAIEDPRTYQMVQWFEPSYDALKAKEYVLDIDSYLKRERPYVYMLLIFLLFSPLVAFFTVCFFTCYCISGGFFFGYFGTIRSVVETYLNPWLDRCYTRVMFSHACLKSCYTRFKESVTHPGGGNLRESLLSLLPYSAQTVITIIAHIVASESFSAIWAADREYMFETDHDSESQTESIVKKENLNVDFNAWEFNKSDELWVGIVSKIYEKVEVRLQNHMQEDSATGKKRKLDFKAKWRVKKAVELLIKQYGGPRQVGLRVMSVFILLCSVPVVTWVIAVYHEFVGAWFVLLGFLAPLVPVVKFLISSNSYASTSRGEVLFQQAEGNKVKSELINLNISLSHVAFFLRR